VSTVDLGPGTWNNAAVTSVPLGLAVRIVSQTLTAHEHRYHTSVDVTASKDQNLALIRHDHQTRAVLDTVHIRDLDPRMRGAVLCVEEQALITAVGDDDGAVDAASGSPLHKGRRGGDVARVCGFDEDVVLAGLEVVGGVGDGVVHAVLVGGAEGWGGEVADFVGGDPFTVAHLGHGDHAGAESVVLEGNL